MWMLLLNLACSPTPAPAPALPPPVSKLATAPLVTEISAEELSDLLTKPGPSLRVLNFWATWCKPCVAELPLLEQAASDPAIDVVLIATDLPSVGRTRVPQFLDKHSIRSPRSALLADDDIHGTLGTIPGWSGQLPHTIVVQPDGSTGHIFAGALDATRLQAVLP